MGPFTHLRPAARLGEGAKAGAFVEIKNSTSRAGAKVPHLSYIGDADLGEGTNIGAGTITANYDGRTKHRTVIGRDVRTGVHTSLVAPVTVGDGAYTGAGSVITRGRPARGAGHRPGPAGECGGLCRERARRRAGKGGKVKSRRRRQEVTTGAPMELLEAEPQLGTGEAPTPHERPDALRQAADGVRRARQPGAGRTRSPASSASRWARSS